MKTYFITDSPNGVLTHQTVIPDMQNRKNLMICTSETPKMILMLLFIRQLLKIEASPTHEYDKT
jgi:hypothetical protein